MPIAEPVTSQELSDAIDSFRLNADALFRLSWRLQAGSGRRKLERIKAADAADRINDLDSVIGLCSTRIEVLLEHIPTQDE